MEKEIAEKRDWSLLSSELLLSVAEHLRLADVSRLPAVCGGWAWTLGRARSGWPPPPPTLRATFVPIDKSTPWLLLPNEDGDEAEFCDFLCPSERASQSGAPLIRISPLPEMAGRICVGGSPDGWIATVDIWLNPRILNLVTREEFLLPSLCTISPYNKITPLYSQEGEDCSMCMIAIKDSPYDIPFGEFKYSFVRKIIISSAPPSGIAFLIHEAYSRTLLAMARVGDLTWTALDLSEFKIGDMEDIVFNENDNKIYAISLEGQVVVMDLKNYHWGSFQPPKTTLLGDMLMEDCKLLSERKYVVFSSRGDLLQVWRQYECYSENEISHLLEEPTNDEEWDSSPIVRDETISIKVFKFDPGHYDGETPGSCWVHIEDLGDEALFVGLNHSTCITTCDKPWLRRNSVYFVEDTLNFRDSGGKNYTCDGGIYDLKHNKIECFFPTYSLVNWPPPAWFMPSRLQFIL